MRKLADLKAAVSVLPHMAEAWRVSRAQDGGGLTVFLFLVSLFFFFIFLFVSFFSRKRGVYKLEALVSLPGMLEQWG